MEAVKYLRTFYKEVLNDNSTIFDYAKVSEFERNLYISVSKLLNEKYAYNLKGLTKLHYVRLNRDLRIEKEDMNIISRAFKLNSMITKRAITMGYGGGYSEKKVIKSYKLELFLVDLENFIRELSNKNDT